MSDFKVTKIIDAHTIQVSPFWEMELKNVKIKGDRINIRGLEGLPFDTISKERLEKILLDPHQEISFNSPEIINSENHDNAIVSCSVYIARTNIAYYFPELINK